VTTDNVSINNNNINKPDKNTNKVTSQCQSVLLTTFCQFTKE